jgi:hypothetical protein
MFAVRGSEVVLLTVLDGRRDLGELLIERALRRTRLTPLLCCPGS